MCGTLSPFEKPHDAARQDAEALVLAALLADVEQRLLPHADAEERPPRRDVLADRLHEAAAAQVRHRVGRRADARHDQRLSVLQVRRVRRDQRARARVHDARDTLCRFPAP